MFEHRYGIKLKKTTADATALKLLRQCFPTQSFFGTSGENPGE